MSDSDIQTVSTEDAAQLLAAAESAANQAYAPYSKFRVGAAVLTEKGVFTGANIENASSNLGICAERVALSHARMHQVTKIIGIAVNCIDAPEVTDLQSGITMPCGGCRQWFVELAPEAWIITNGSQEVFRTQDLLPKPFVLKNSNDTP
ncbi:MAG: cytidine deaminase [Desulfobulbaceae bacterium]|nr:MAG: cytidine deaminase [Desulfobulbaceae bacterium]